MSLFVSAPNAAMQFAGGAVFASIAVLFPTVARWVAISLVLALVGMAVIVAMLDSVEAVFASAVQFMGFAPFLAPTLVGLVSGKAVTGLLVGR